MSLLKYFKNTAKSYVEVGDDNPLPTQLSGSNVAVPVTNKRLHPVGQLTKLDIPTYDGSNQPVHPCVVYIPKGFGPAGQKYKFWMCFTPFPAGNSDYENPSVVASNDCINWVVPAGVTNPIVPAPADLVNFFNRDPELIYDGTQLIIYWSTSDRRDSSAVTYRKTSSDGVIWSAPVTCNKGFGSFCIVRKSATEWYLWAATDTARQLRRYRSTDGINWNDDIWSRTNIDGSLWHPSVFIEPEGYHFLGAPYRRGGKTEEMSLYYGFSPDCTDIMFDTTPVYIPEFSGWTSGQVYRSSMVRGENQTYHLFVSAYDKDANKWSINHVPVVLMPTQNGGQMLGKSVYQRKTILLADKVQIRDAATLHFVNKGSIVTTDYAIADWDSFEYHSLEILNSHDQAVTVGLKSYLRGSSYDSLRYGPTQAIQEVSMPANGGYAPTIIDSTHVATMKGMMTSPIAITATCGTAPTVGDLTIRLNMWNPHS